MADDPPATESDAAARLSAALNAPLDALRGQAVAAAPLAGPEPAPFVPGLRLRPDPEAGFTATWESPRGRILSLQGAPARPGRWLGLHLEMPAATDLTGIAWFGFALRAAAGRPMALRACLRSGREGGGFTDIFLARHALVLPAAGDHHDMLAPDRVPDLPLRAPWREFILFLPPAEPVDLGLHDLRVWAL